MGAEKGKTNRNIRGCFTLNHCHQSVSLTRQERWRYASTQSFSLFHTHKHTHTHIFMTWFLRVFPLICIHLFTGISAKSVAAYVFIYTHVLHVHSLCHAHAAHSYAYRPISHACVHTQQHGVMTAFAHTHTHIHIASCFHAHTQEFSSHHCSSHFTHWTTLWTNLCPVRPLWFHVLLSLSFWFHHSISLSVSQIGKMFLIFPALCSILKSRGRVIAYKFFHPPLT